MVIPPFFLQKQPGHFKLPTTGGTSSQSHHRDGFPLLSDVFKGLILVFPGFEAPVGFRKCVWGMDMFCSGLELPCLSFPKTWKHLGGLDTIPSCPRILKVPSVS